MGVVFTFAPWYGVYGVRSTEFLVTYKNSILKSLA
jgi:hypothetical protein